MKKVILLSFFLICITFSYAQLSKKSTDRKWQKRSTTTKDSTWTWDGKILTYKQFKDSLRVFYLGYYKSTRKN